MRLPCVRQGVREAVVGPVDHLGSETIDGQTQRAHLAVEFGPARTGVPPKRAAALQIEQGAAATHEMQLVGYFYREDPGLHFGRAVTEHGTPGLVLAGSRF